MKAAGGWRSWFGWWLLAGCCAALSCSKTTTPASESNTNWLNLCDKDAACGSALRCACGVCTVACELDETCAQRDAITECRSVSSACDEGEGGATSACFAKCELDDDCAGSGTRCHQGLCVGEIAVGNPPAGAGGSGGARSGGSGGSAGGDPPPAADPAELRAQIERDHAEWVACEQSADCMLLEPGNCCSICGEHPPDDFVVVHADHAQEAREFMDGCPAEVACPAILCYRLAVIPVCREQRCRAIDIRQDETLAGCENDADCTLRLGTECCTECSIGYPTIAHRADAAFEQEVCGDTECDCEVLGDMPTGVARCVDGFCAAVP